MLKKLLLFSAVLLIFAGCGKNEEEKKEAEQLAASGVHKVTVKEVQQVSQYTYLRVEEGEKDYWMAVTRREVKEGQTFYYRGAMEMKNFTSPELKKTFETILFVEDLSEQSPVAPQQSTPMGKNQPMKPDLDKAEIKIDKAAGGITIAELYSDLKKYSGKEITIKGKILRVNNGIMKRNWLHIQDGTSAGANFDLTVTTDQEFNEGDVVTLKGKVALDQDFGYGYSYPVLLENAVALKNL